eukprot:241911-Prorocentrum_minimum.AAC.1
MPEDELRRACLDRRMDPQVRFTKTAMRRYLGEVVEVEKAWRRHSNLLAAGQNVVLEPRGALGPSSASSAAGGAGRAVHTDIKPLIRPPPIGKFSFPQLVCGGSKSSGDENCPSST